MSVTITHWYGCGYPDHAALLAKEIRGALGVEVTVIAGGDERELTVRVGERVVLTRRELGRLPTPDEALERVAAQLAR